MRGTNTGCLNGEERERFFKGKLEDHLVRNAVKEFHFG